MRMARQLLEAVMNREQLPLDKAQDRAASLILESLDKDPGKEINGLKKHVHAITQA